MAPRSNARTMCASGRRLPSSVQASLVQASTQGSASARRRSTVRSPDRWVRKLVNLLVGDVQAPIFRGWPDGPSQAGAFDDDPQTQGNPGQLRFELVEIGARSQAAFAGAPIRAPSAVSSAASYAGRIE